LSDAGVEVTLLPVDRTGKLKFEKLAEAIRRSPALVSIQWVNNETGVIQDIESIADLCNSSGTLFHTDACQAVGKLNVDLERVPIDFLSLTAHKFHGPQGVGALYARKRDYLRPLFFGGSQEHGIRPGTENVAGIVGLGQAAALRFERLETLRRQFTERRDFFETLVLQTVPHVDVNGDTTRRVSNTTNLLFRGVDGQALVARLDQEGIRCSQSSACTNHRPEPSYVLRAMGLTEDEAYSSVRFSVSEETTEDELEIAATTIARICDQLGRFHTPQRAAKSVGVS
jgi:cysteine desulfurase